MLGNCTGHNCYMKVTRERASVRGGIKLRGAFDPGEVAPHVAAPRANRELENLKLEDVGLDGPAALGLLYNLGPAQDSPAPPSGAPTQRKQRPASESSAAASA